jgi:hypothetical protein
MSENTTQFVSSRGLMKICQFGKLFHPLSNYYEIPLCTDLQQLQCNSVLYLSAQKLDKHILDNIHCKVIIVVGDDDHTFPYSYFPNSNIEYDNIDPRKISNCNSENLQHFYNHSDFVDFIESEKIIHCFIQNCAIIHPKITKIPIGMDYHTFRNQGLTPQRQENIMMNIHKNAPPFWERIPKCYGNFHFSYKGSKFGYDRIDAMTCISTDCIVYEPIYSQKYECYQHQTQFAFVISPHGNGLDCHRTWESICLGCIPIVKTSVLDDLYDGLPVLIVQDWSDITMELLKNTIAEFKERIIHGNGIGFSMEKMTLHYWRTLIFERNS